MTGIGGGARRQADQALAVPVEPVTRLDPTGFDPSRLASLSFVLPYDDGGARLSVSHDSRSKYWGKQVLISQYESDDRVIYVELADLDWLIGALKLVAIATETQRAETENTGSVEDEGAGLKGIARKVDHD